MTSALAWLKANVALVKFAALGLVVLLLVYAWNREHRLASELRQRSEDLSGQLVASQKSGHDMKADLTRAQDGNALLAQKLKDALAQAPGSKPVEVLQAKTDRAPAHGQARAPAPLEPAAAPASGLSAPCLLVEGDELQAEVDEVTLETNGGNRIIVGTVTINRLALPAGPIFRSPFSASLSTVSEEEQPKPPRWGAGAFGSCVADKCSAGPVVAFPPLRLFGMQLEAAAGIGAGSGGAAVLGSIVVRW